MLWSDAPDPDEVHENSNALSTIRALIIRKNREISKKDARLKREYPRRPHEREIELEKELDELAELQIKEIELKAEYDFYRTRMEMFRSFQWRKV